MPDHVKRIETMLGSNVSIYKSDFKECEIQPILPTKYEEQGRGCSMIRPPSCKDVHSMSDWRKRAPFDLFRKPKDCVGRNPHDVQKPYDKLEDYERKQVQMTRPRVIMTPAGSLDDAEKRDRELLIDATYTTSTGDMMRFTKNPSNLMAPRPSLPAPPNPITIPKLNSPYVPPEWRMDTLSWDRKQIRGYCVPTRLFWLARPQK